MADPFSSARYSLDHAKRRLAEFKREINDWVASNPYSVVVETNSDSTEDIHKVKLTILPPIPLSGMVFDTVSNLRATLDRLGFATAVAANPSSGKFAKFPFGVSETEIRNRRTQHQDIPKEIFEVMMACQPYETGNVLFWSLNNLCNTNKHEVAVAVPFVTNAPGVPVDSFYFPSLIEFRWPPVWDAAKNEMIIARVPYGTKCQYQLQITTTITIGDIKGVVGKEAVGVLDYLTNIVERVLVAIEAEAQRMGLIT